MKRPTCPTCGEDVWDADYCPACKMPYDLDPPR